MADHFHKDNAGKPQTQAIVITISLIIGKKGFEFPNSGAKNKADLVSLVPEEPEGDPNDSFNAGCREKRMTVQTPSGSYSGDITVQEAWEALQNDEMAVLVDVRTLPEWQFVGVPDLSSLGKKVLTVSWQVYPAMDVNSNFVDVIRAQGLKADNRIFMICRSGVRSIASSVALCAEGFQAFNVLDGFEGTHDEQGHRGRKAGWKAAGLPWQQG